MATENQAGWRTLCEAASKEQDSQRLIELVSRLLASLDGCKKDESDGGTAESCTKVA